ncbi:MAG: GAF domain-containing protein [Desulfobacteraceae bacterium]|nr:MAG: GAF domain-containing protein [Desulfobacteraceae bacterium]
MNALLRKNRELSAILKVSQELTTSFNLEENMLSAMQILGTHLEMQRGCVFLLDPDTFKLRIIAAHGLTQREISRGIYQVGEGIVGRVLETGKPMFVPNIGKEPMFLNKTGSRPEKKGISFFCSPIAIEGKTIGVITVDRIFAEEDGTVDDDLRVLSIIASFIAQFVILWRNFKNTENEIGKLRSQLKEKYSLPNIIGESVELQRVLKSVIKVAATDTTVLLLGESGTGKELVAQTVHYQSLRARERFVAVNLAALPENLIEAELFGVEKGAYTGATEKRIGRFEMAHKGTLFLDEIGELPLNLQVKLLRVLQERSFEKIGSTSSVPVDVRVVAATNRNLFEEVRKGNFREDLYWRLNVVPIMLPPLRKRTGDIPLLADFYLNKFNQLYNRGVKISPRALNLLEDYSWPGNVREFANTIERLVIMLESEVVMPDDLPFNLNPDQKVEPVMSPGNIAEKTDLKKEIESIEKEQIIRALKDNNYIQNRASRSLGITLRQFGYRLKKYDINFKRL